MLRDASRTSDDPLGRGNLACATGVYGDGHAERSCTSLERCFRHMVRIGAGQLAQMQREEAVSRQGAKKLLDQLRIHGAEYRPLEIYVPTQIGAAREVDRCINEGFVHRNAGLSKPVNSPLLA
jgi:hypothetical protein